ncbi:MAG: hypothetical protein NC078_07345 [Ruminococcus sp.]|nr:hypothetical protein [Ruminococcus sp.]
MKKRAMEAVAILAVLIVLFAVLNRIAAAVEDNTVKIDGEYYNTGISELSLTLMTEEGLENLGKLPRLTNLKITPFKEAAADAAAGDDPAARAAVLAEYSEYTDLADLSAIQGLTWLEKLDVSYCHVSGLDFAAGMQGLVSLNIGCTEITDLSLLTEFPALERLIICNTPADSLAPLLEMDSLQTVILSKETAEKFPDIITSLAEKGIEVEIRE